MKNLISILLISIPALLFSQRAFKDKQWYEDLDFMIARLESIHPNLYVNIDKKRLYEERDKLKEKIPELSDDEIIVELLKIVTKVKDGHTRLHGKRLTKTWYPIRIERFSDGYFITAIDKEHKLFVGSKVKTINGLAVEEVFKLLYDITPHDNDYGQEYFAPMYLSMSSIVRGLHLTVSSNKNLILVMENNNKEIVLSQIEFTTGDDLGWYWSEYAVPTTDYYSILKADTILPIYLQNYHKPYWFKSLNEKTLYFAFNECKNDNEENFEDFNKKLWNTIDLLNIEYLIIDLRNNFGGTNSILEPLIHEIIKHDKINQKGNLFVITGKKTFSAALHCATWIEFHCNPTFVGEPTGAAPNHYADPDFSFLPNSKILLMVSKYYWQNTWPWDTREFIEPELKVNISSEDYFNYKDPAIDEIYKFIDRNE
ncbi:MAG: hypothetical protein KKB34_01355 [Bacteroidetes bacterium]|nr:hypothetical protein [Bacteroidota bacterium]